MLSLRFPQPGRSESSRAFHQDKVIGPDEADRWRRAISRRPRRERDRRGPPKRVEWRKSDLLGRSVWCQEKIGRSVPSTRDPPTPDRVSRSTVVPRAHHESPAGSPSLIQGLRASEVGRVHAVRPRGSAAGDRAGRKAIGEPVSRSARRSRWERPAPRGEVRPHLAIIVQDAGHSLEHLGDGTTRSGVAAIPTCAVTASSTRVGSSRRPLDRPRGAWVASRDRCGAGSSPRSSTATRDVSTGCDRAAFPSPDHGLASVSRAYLLARRLRRSGRARLVPSTRGRLTPRARSTEEHRSWSASADVRRRRSPCVDRAGSTGGEIRSLTSVSTAGR